MGNKNYHIILLSVIFAILLWFLINMNYEYVTTEKVSINLINLENIALKKTIPNSFFAKIKGRGWDLLSFIITKDPEFNLDLSNVKSGYWRLIKKEILEGISIPPNLSALDASIDSINLYTDIYDSVKIPVKLNVDIKFKEGYASVGDYNIYPDSILVKGAKSIIDTLSGWKTKKVQINNVSDKIKLKIPLEEMPKYVISSDIYEVELNLTVEPFADKTFSSINLIVNSLPDNKEVILIPPKIDIIVRGSINRLAEITPESIKAYIEYSELLTDTTGYIRPKFLIPNKLQVVNSNPEKFQYIIRKRLM